MIKPAPRPDTLAADATHMLERLVAIDTTSWRSNLDLIELVEAELSPLGATIARVADATGKKANLYATIGPQIAGGVVLSGHTDVVPVDGQPWTSDPFSLTLRGDKFYGRGTCDMKAFLALALATARFFAVPGRLRRPVHFAFSYDEEVGCLGAPSMIREIADRLPKPLAVIVGEPTSMEVVGAHKGINSYRVTVTGHEAHSSLTHRGLSANMVAIRLMSALDAIAQRLEDELDVRSPFCPKHATLTVGQIHGGTAVNILARECVFVFDLRCPPAVDPDHILAPFLKEVEATDAAMKHRFPEAGIHVERRSRTPPLELRPGSDAELLARRLSGHNGPSLAVAYAAEAGQFQQAGFSTIICGPGSIDQAHQPDEFIHVEQIDRGAEFMLRLLDSLAS